MNITFKRAFSLTLLLSLFPLFCNATPLRVGVIAGLTGAWGAYGKSYETGLTIAQQKEPESLLSIRYEDDQFTPRLALAAFRKLRIDQAVDVLIIGDTQTAMALAPEVQKYKIPTFVWATEHELFVNNPYIIRTWPKLALEVQRYAAELKQAGITNAAIWAGPHTYSVSFVDALADAAPESISQIEKFPEDSNDYRSQLLKLKQSGRKSLGLCLNSGQNAMAIRQAKQLALDLTFFGCSFINNGEDTTALTTTGGSAWLFDTVISESFRIAYRKKTGSEHLINSAALMHDVGVLLQKVARQMGPQDTILEKVKTVGAVNGASGEFSITFQQGEQFINFALAKKVLP